MTEIAELHQIIDVTTGEVLPTTPTNAHRALLAIKEKEQQLREVKAAVLAYVIEESQRQGTKTIHTPEGDVTLTGGASVEYDPQQLEALLRESGLPEERIREVVKEEISYKVNRRVLNQLTAANPDYKAAADLASHPTEAPYRASAK